MPDPIAIAALVADLERRGIVLFLAEGEIRYRSPRNALTETDRQDLRARRPQIADWLLARDAAKGLRNIRPAPGPLTPSVGQEMWWRFAGGAQEGKPFALNIGIVGTFGDTDADAVAAAIRAVIGHHEALRVAFQAQGETLLPSLNPADAFLVEQEDLRGLTPDAARQAAEARAQEFCSRVNFIEGQWLTRAKVIALPEGRVMAAISCAHMIADAGTRNILLDELRDRLEGKPVPPSAPYNDYAMAEREFLAGPQGTQLIEHWRRWYDDQPMMRAPSDGTPMLWGNGTRIVRNFVIPAPVLEKVRALADAMKVTPFLVYLTIFSVAMARWSGMEHFPIRVLGDKRTSLALSNMVGLMFCADAVEIHAPTSQNFETVLRGILSAYDAALARRIPTLHFWAPHCVRPGIEARDFPNRIPAVFNYYAVGTAREKAEKQATPAGPESPWPPVIATLPPQTWPRRSSPVFLHVMDYGVEAAASLHFYQDVVCPADQEAFVATLFQVFAETVPV